VTARDRLIIVAVLVVAVLGGVWFVGLAPKRKQAADLQQQIDTASQQLADAQQKAATARQAKARYDKDYADIATLGKAVTKSDALPSLIYQLQSAARNARIDFRSLKVSGGGGQGPVASTPSTPANTANAAKNNGTSGSAPAPAAAPATQASSATLPPGAAVGSAGFPTMPFSFVFNGSFFDMESFFRDVQRFVRVKGAKVDVSGRLLSIDAFSLVAGPDGFPSVKSSISATAYLLSPDDANTTAPASTGTAPSTGGTTPPAANAPTVSEVAR
jgi:Tfp pilus assembly protein PilO